MAVGRSTSINSGLDDITSAYRGRCNIAKQSRKPYSTGSDDGLPSDIVHTIAVLTPQIVS